MAGNKDFNLNVNIFGKATISTVPNNIGTVVTWDSVTKELSTRTNSQFIGDLGLATQSWVTSQITNATHSHSNKAFLDTINQNLGTSHSPTFNGITTGYLIDTFKGFNSSTPFSFFNSNLAQSIYTGGVLASNAYADASKIPTNGIYSKGNVLTSGSFVKEGGTASQFLKADGSVDGTGYVPYTGATQNLNLGNFTGTFNGVYSTGGLKYTKAINVNNTDLNTLTDAGFYDGYGLINAPDNSSAWFYITVQRHSNNSNWCHQTAILLEGATGGKTWTRYKDNGSWSPWKRVWGENDFTQSNISTWNSLSNTAVSQSSYAGYDLINYVPTISNTIQIGLTYYNYQQPVSVMGGASQYHPSMMQGMMIAAKDSISVHNFGIYADWTGQLFVGGGTYGSISWLKVWTEGNFNPAQYVQQSALNTQLSGYATLAGTQTFTGTNTFSQSPIVPNPTLDGHAVNRGWVNNQFLPLTGGTLSGPVTINSNLGLTINYPNGMLIGNGYYAQFRASALNNTGITWVIPSEGKVDVLVGTNSAFGTLNHYANNLTINDNIVWHAGNFNPAQYVQISSLNNTLSNYVPKVGAFTIEGTKTFTESPVVPPATLNGHAVNKEYVDSQNANNIKNQYAAAQSGNFWINGNGRLDNLYATDKVYIGRLPSNSAYSGIWFTHSPDNTNYAFLYDNGVGTVLNAPAGERFMFRINNQWNEQLELTTNKNLRIGYSYFTTDLGHRLQVNGSIYQTGVTSGLIKSNNGVFVQAVENVDYAGINHGHAISDVTGLQSELDNRVTIDTTQTIIGSKTFASTSTVDFLGTENNHVKVFRDNLGTVKVVSGHEYTHYNTRWKVGNKRGFSDDSIGFAFHFSTDGGSTYAEKVVIGTNGNIITENYGNSAAWNQAYQWGNHSGLYSLLGHTHAINDVTGLQSALDGKEPVFTKNSAFNKNFGTTAGTVAEGNHTHSNYVTLDTVQTIEEHKHFGVLPTGDAPFTAFQFTNKMYVDSRVAEISDTLDVFEHYQSVDVTNSVSISRYGKISHITITDAVSEQTLTILNYANETTYWIYNNTGNTVYIDIGGLVYLINNGTWKFNIDENGNLTLMRAPIVFMGTI